MYKSLIFVNDNGIMGSLPNVFNSQGRIHQAVESWTKLYFDQLDTKVHTERGEIDDALDANDLSLVHMMDSDAVCAVVMRDEGLLCYVICADQFNLRRGKMAS